MLFCFCFLMGCECFVALFERCAKNLNFPERHFMFILFFLTVCYELVVFLPENDYVTCKIIELLCFIPCH